MVSNKLNADSALQLCERSFLAALSCFSLPEKLPTDRRWLIAHSGGIDSQLLLYLAARILPKSSLLVVYVNHHLQEGADQWAEFSSQQAKKYGLKHLVLDVYPKSRSENAARDERYQAFENLIEQGDVMLFGHHADDQAETLLYRMLRGTGLSGLAGMPVSRALGKGSLLRPLLKCTREQIESAAESLTLKCVNDPSNESDVYDRNYLRNKVFPLLKARWPMLVERWQDNAELLQDTDKLLEIYLDADLELCSSAPELFELGPWSEMPELKQTAVLRHWIYRALGLRLNTKTLEKIISDVIQSQLDAEPEFILGDVCLRRFQNRLFLVREFKEPVINIMVTANGEYNLGDGVLQIQGLPGSRTLKILRRQGGETCCPVGRKTKSVKKILQESSIPPWHRKQWPLVYCDDKLIAVPGVCLCQGSGIEEKPDFSVLWRPFSLSDNS